jgi:hypothetical protein
MSADDPFRELQVSSRAKSIHRGFGVVGIAEHGVADLVDEHRLLHAIAT